MNILVTGASGFIGCALIKHLAGKDHKITALSRNIPQNRSKTDSILWVQHDLCSNAAMNGLLHNVDCVVHLAGNAHENRKKPYAEYYEVNTRQTISLANEAIKQNVKKFIFISTIKVNGEGTNSSAAAFNENSEALPTDSYARSKYEAEKLLIATCNDAAMKYVILRPPLVFGVGVKANFLTLLKIVNSGFPLPFALVENTRSFIYLDNLVDLIARCVSSQEADNKTYLIRDFSLSLRELIGQLSFYMNSGTRLFPCPEALLRLMAKISGNSAMIEKLLLSVAVDDRKIRHELAWQPRVDMKKALENTVQWFKQERDCEHG